MTDWERIVREHGPRVFGTAWRILGHAADAEDVVQEVFLQAHRLEALRPVRYWSAFLHRLAACRALDRLRQRRGTVRNSRLKIGPNISGIRGQGSGVRRRSRLPRYPLLYALGGKGVYWRR